MNFSFNLLAKHVENAASAIQSAVIKADPVTAGEAQIQTIIDAISQANFDTAEKQQALESAKSKVASDQKAIAEATRAAEILAGRGDAAAQTERLMTEIETILIPRLEADKKMLVSIEQVSASLAKHKADLEQNLANARSQLSLSAAEMERSKLELRMAEQQRADAARNAGFSKTLSGINVASDAMNVAAAKMRARAEAAKLDASSLSGAAPSQSDPAVAAAFAEVEAL